MLIFSPEKKPNTKRMEQLLARPAGSPSQVSIFREEVSRIHEEVRAAVASAIDARSAAPIAAARNRAESYRRHILVFQHENPHYGQGGVHGAEVEGVLGNFRQILKELGEAQTRLKAPTVPGHHRSSAR